MAWVIKTNTKPAPTNAVIQTADHSKFPASPVEVSNPAIKPEYDPGAVVDSGIGINTAPPNIFRGTKK